MITREQRSDELYSSGLVDSVKTLFKDKNVRISEDYYVLIADYIDSLNEVKDSMLIDPTEIAKKLPEVLTYIQDENIGGIYGRTDGTEIRMSQSLDYDNRKLYFFHELTHALQTNSVNGREQCAFANENNGMFLTEASTQYTAEMLYHISNGTQLDYRQQSNTVRGQSDRTTYSPLSEYQYNGNILMLLSKSMDLPLPQVLALAYKPNGRETLKNIYESMDGNQGKFEGLMQDLEKVYSIDKMIIYGYGEQLKNGELLLEMSNGTQFNGSLDIQKELMNKTERELVANFVENHDNEFVMQNYKDIMQYLTTPELKQQFLAVVQELGQDLGQNTNEIEQTQSTPKYEMPEGYSINEFGEIIRPDRAEQQTETTIETNEVDTRQDAKLTLRQRIAQGLQKNSFLMNIPFVEKYVNKQLNILPEHLQRTNEVSLQMSSRESFLQSLSVGVQRDLPPIQRMSDPEKIAEMRRKMEQNQRSNDDDELSL